MKREFLNRYWVVIRCYDAALDPLKNQCLSIARSLEQDAKALDVKADLERELRYTDIVVVLCTSITDAVLKDCAITADTRRVMLLFCVGEPDDTSWERVRARVDRDVAGSTAHRLKHNRLSRFVALFQPLLTRAIRLLDTPQNDHLANPFLARFLRRLRRWRILESRLDYNSRYKLAIAEFFLDLYLKPLIQAGVSHLFFESGSSIAFLGERFLLRLDEQWVQLESDVLHIETNNILCFMEFIEARGVRLELFPDGPPETKYGATFGRIGSVTPEKGPLSHKALEVMSEIKDHLNLYKKDGLIFGATSGIDLDPASERPGPHTGSFHNMLLKRAILESEAPQVIFLDQDKLPYDFKPDRCFAVCDDDFTWAHVCEKLPIALACAFESEERGEEALSMLKAAGFTNVLRSRSNEDPWCMIAANAPFAERSWQPEK